MINNKLEFLIDWESVGERSIFFDIYNIFVPWFIHRNYNYKDIKFYISKFIKTYVPALAVDLLEKYDL